MALISLPHPPPKGLPGLPVRRIVRAGHRGGEGWPMTIRRKIYLAAVLGFILTGCSQVPVTYTITSGSHIRASDPELANSQNPDQQPALKYVVWGNHQGAINTVIEILQQNGQRVVERARLQEIFDEQKVSLTHSSEDDINLLRVGKLVGADRIIFVETTVRTESFTPSLNPLHRFFLALEAAGAAQQGRDPLYLRTPLPDATTVYRPSVLVRAVRLDSGEITWNGKSTTSQAISDLDATIVTLTHAAISRAVCPIERGAVWIEGASDGSRQPWGCKGK